MKLYREIGIGTNSIKEFKFSGIFSRQEKIVGWNRGNKGSKIEGRIHKSNLLEIGRISVLHFI